MRREWLFLSVNAVRLYALHAALHTQNASLQCVKGRKNCVQFFCAICSLSSIFVKLFFHFQRFSAVMLHEDS